jgi:hypothetical protein
VTHNLQPHLLTKQAYDTLTEQRSAGKQIDTLHLHRFFTNELFLHPLSIIILRLLPFNYTELGNSGHEKRAIF